MRPDAEFEAVQQLIRAGLNDCAISRATGIPRGTIRDWRHQGDRTKRDSRAQARLRPPWSTASCPLCHHRDLDPEQYAYLLGLYLGDGAISSHARGVFRLRISLDDKYPLIIEECRRAISVVRGIDVEDVGKVQAIGCSVVNAYWKHWPCVFPQHGEGRKHDRPIVLQWWQRAVVRQHPQRLLRGLIHSDGSRDSNVVNGKSYPRYQFSNESTDIRGVFIDGCESVGLHWTTPSYKVISISRRADVAKMDAFIGPKANPTRL